MAEASEDKVEVFNPLDQALKTTDIDIAKVQAEILETEKGKVDDPKGNDEDETPEDDELSEDESEDTSEDDGDESEDDTKAKDTARSKNYSNEYTETKTEVKQIANKINDIIEDVKAIEPVKPKDDSDIEAMEAFEEELKEYKREALRANRRIERLNSELGQKVRKLQDEFVKSHKNEDLSGFEDFMRGKKTYLAEVMSGEEDLEFFYQVYKLKNGGKKLSQIKKISKGGKKPIDFGTGGSPNTEGGNGLPAKYTYANKEVFSDWVKDLRRDMKAGKKMPDGKPITNDLIEALCKQEYKLIPKSLLKG